MAERADFEHQPLSRKEYMDALVHLYRGEMQRATTWRLRLDNTTNWSIVVTITALSYAYSDVSRPHAIILVGMVIVLMLLAIEARRYRFYDVWRTRIRKMEENFFAPILRRDLLSLDEGWGRLVAEDFLHPRFKIRMSHALKSRLTKNYLFIFAVFYLGWFAKVYIVATTGPSGESLPLSGTKLWRAMAFHSISAESILVVLAVISAALISLLFVRIPKSYSGEVHEVTEEQVFWDR